MRTGWTIGVLSLSLCLAMPAIGQAQSAQQQQAATFFTGVNPRQITNKPIDVSKAYRAFDMTNSFRPPRQPTGFTLSNFFPRISLGSWPPRRANPPSIPPSNFQNPFANPGTNPFGSTTTGK